MSYQNSNTSTLTTTQRQDMDSYRKEENLDVFGILEIPTINLKNPIYKKDSSKNKVDLNIELLEETISKEENYYIVLASHSGSGLHAYFKNLEKLKTQDSINFIYENEIHTYEYFKKSEVPKIGTVYLEKYDFPYIAMITCSKTKNDIQEIYYAKLVKKEIKSEKVD